jgi:hypothetical protein
LSASPPPTLTPRQLRAYRAWCRRSHYNGSMRRAYRAITAKRRAKALETVWETWVQATKTKLTSWGKLWHVSVPTGQFAPPRA